MTDRTFRDRYVEHVLGYDSEGELTNQIRDLRALAEVDGDCDEVDRFSKDNELDFDDT